MHEIGRNERRVCFPAHAIAVLSVAVLSVLVPDRAATAQEWCGTRVLPEHVAIVLHRMADGIYDPPAWPEGSNYVPLTFHVVRRSNGTGGLDPVRLVRALDDGNVAFANSGISFCWVGPIDYIDSDEFYFNIDTLAEIDALRMTNVVPDTINVYFTQNLAYELGPLCGISSFTFSAVQGIVMANDCTATSNDHATFAHELGHYFDLFHTHETMFGDECPDCVSQPCSCSVAGDLLCDTPADPQLGRHNVDGNCNYFGNERDPCSNSAYQPDPSNYMSYAPPSCPNRLTAQQNFRMQATLLRLRPELIAPNCPGGNAWNLDGKLTAQDGAQDDFFGRVALSGNQALIGAPADDDRGTDSGSAYVFRNINGVWAQVAKLRASHGAADDNFGYSVALSGDRALIGAYGDDDRGTNSGSAYVFERDINGVWVQVAKLTASDGAPTDFFGLSVALSADTALIGAYRDDDRGTDSGSAYVFQRISNVWTERAKLTAPDGAQNDLFGAFVALSGNMALVGAIFDDDRGADSGSAYVFRDLNALRNPFGPGDLNCDGAFNGGDIDPFFLALGDPPTYAAQFPNCDPLLGDMNADGRLDGGDIDPFFACLGGNCP